MNPFSIKGIEYSLGEKKILISSLFENSHRIIERTGISKIYETNLDAEELAYQSAKKILDKYSVSPDCLIYVTQSQKFILPGSAVLLQDKLNLNNNCCVFDINAGCSGFAQALVLASSLVLDFKNILIVCTDTYRKKLAKDDRSTNAVFSDGSASILIQPEKRLIIDKLITQVEGKNHKLLIQKQINSNKDENLFMSGRELWNFTRSNVVPDILNAIEHFKKKDMDIKDIFIHQASKVVVDGIKNSIGGKYLFHENYMDRGNTVSSTIPILLKDKNYNFDDNFIISGFGVGLISYTLAIKKL